MKLREFLKERFKSMKDFIKKWTKRLLAGAFVVVLGVAAYYGGAQVDWVQLGKDAASGEVTNIAQQVEDLAKTEGQGE